MTNKNDPHAELMRLAEDFATVKFVEGIDGNEGRVETALHILDAFARTLTDRLERAERMFGAACAVLGAINEALGLDPDDGGAEPIIDAIKEMQSCVGDGGVGAMALVKCKGNNCTASDGRGHSQECHEEHNATVMSATGLENPFDRRTAANDYCRWEQDRKKALAYSAQPAPAVVGAVANIVKDLLQSARTDGYTHEQQAFIRSIADRIDELNLTPQQIAEPASQWISVDERLPNCGVYVLVALSDPIETGWITDRAFIAEIDNDEEWSGIDQIDDGCIVTHWTPLPPPPANHKEPS